MIQQGPLWTIDVATGAIIDWNVSAARLCGWKKGASRRSFADLSKLLLPAGADPKKAERITLANVLRLARARRPGRGLEARLSRTGAKMRYLAFEAVMTGGGRRRESLLLMAELRRAHPRPGRPRGGRVPAGDAGTGALSAIVGHELNNIAVPLEGFTDLAVQSAKGNVPVRECLEETKIAIGRITALAYELESLGETDSHPTHVPIGRCMPETADLAESWTIDWHCRPAIRVCVDKLQAQRAIRALIHVTTGAAARSASAPVLTVSQDPHSGERCIACGAPVGGKHSHVFAQIDDSYPVLGNALRNPFGARRAGRSTLPLTLAVLVHCAHCAGGHLLRDRASGSVSLAFPTA